MPILGNTTSTEGVQLGVEVIEGLRVPANRRIVDGKITPGWGRTGHTYIPAGYKFPTVNINGREWSTFTYEGALGFGSVVYFLSSGANYAAPSGTPAKTYVFTPGVTTVNTSKSFTIEWGTATAAFAAVACHVVGYDIVINKDEPIFRARMIAQRIIPNITLTASPTVVENVPVSGNYIDVFSASSFANLAVFANQTQLDWVFAYELSVNGLYGQAYPLKSGQTSWAGRYELTPSSTVKVTALEQLSGGDFIGTPFSLADMRAGILNYLRVRAWGGLIGANGALGYVAMTNGGSGYTGTPGVVVGGDGTGATATATQTGGVIDPKIVVTAPGSGYTFFTFTFTGGPGAGAEAVGYFTPAYLFQIDQGLISTDDTPVLSDMDGLRVVEWPLQLSPDPVANKAVEFTVVNQTTV